MTAVKRTKALEAMWAVHRWLYRRTNGRLGSKVNGMPVLWGEQRQLFGFGESSSIAQSS